MNQNRSVTSSSTALMYVSSTEEGGEMVNGEGVFLGW